MSFVAVDLFNYLYLKHNRHYISLYFIVLKLFLKMLDRPLLFINTPYSNPINMENYINKNVG